MLKIISCATFILVLFLYYQKPAIALEYVDPPTPEELQKTQELYRICEVSGGKIHFIYSGTEPLMRFVEYRECICPKQGNVRLNDKFEGCNETQSGVSETIVLPQNQYYYLAPIIFVVIGFIALVLHRQRK